MAKKFKDYYDEGCAILLANKIEGVHSPFKKNDFINNIRDEIVGKEFLERQDIFATAFEHHMTGDYENDITVFYNILGPELEGTHGMFTYGWWLWPVGLYVERHGIKNPELSLNFIYELTKRFTGEFAIRPLISANPKKTLEVILKWSKDNNVHVRRLSSECMRIRLPWAKKSFSAVNEFELYKQILTNLKDDKEKFVQKSVGNNLNDLMKEDPALANQIISEWENSNPGKETLWIIKHGKRSMNKKTTSEAVN